MEKDFDIAIIGGGPGGYVAAIRAAQLKKRVLLIEKERLGGECMNWGCIPTKYLLHQTKMIHDLKENGNVEGPRDSLTLNWSRVQKEKESVIERLVGGIDLLLEKNGVTTIKGEAQIDVKKHITVRSEKGFLSYYAEKIILAAGSRSASLPFLPSNSGSILTNREILSLETVPRSLLVIGAGAIGLEMATIFRRLGSDVIVLELMPTILPGSDKTMVGRLHRILKQEGLNILTQMRIESCRFRDGMTILEGISLRDQKPFEFSAEKVLVAAGRKPNSERLLAQPPKNWLGESGFVKVGRYLETAVPGVYAVGDLIGGKLLAHKASHEGIIAVENAFRQNREVDHRGVPGAVFTDPELASVGWTEQEASEAGTKIKTGLFSLQSSARAVTMGKTQGMVKILADESDRIVGAHILSPNAGEMIAELTLAVGKGMKLQDVSSSIHIHPTLSESVMEAALKAEGAAIHALNL